MSNVEFLANLDSNKLRQLAQWMDEGEITHAIMCYRREDGSLSYMVSGDEHATYCMGMLARTSMQLHLQTLDDD